ncbi:hypothetical protein [Clostridium sp. KNHs214]|uniref:hypothetical protein n=1 Tax=Clostridium sp. KNHs214 TaxID=1540257 RepID=UPI00054CEED3|nr:hypothetical protein [Clostridium sp. KNHs214]
MIKLEIFIGSIIECFFVIGTGLSFLGIYLNFKTLLKTSLVNGIILYFIRIIYLNNKIPLGSHTFIIMIIIILYLTLFLKISLLKSIISILISLALVLLGEGIFIPLLKGIIPRLYKKFGLAIIAFFISHCFLIISFFINYSTKKTIINLNK